MTDKPIRVYADTSVFGGVFDEEFAGPSRAFFDLVQEGRFDLVLSTVVRDELDDAPSQVKELFDRIRLIAEIVDVSESAIRLQRAYLETGVLAPTWAADALHVAVATVCDCRLIVSWNFKHIVNFHKIPLYNGTNLASGYSPIAIHSPQEVVVDEDQDV